MEKKENNKADARAKKLLLVQRASAAARGPNDLLFGARAIAAYLGLNERQVFHQVAEKKIPAKRMGPKLLVASKEELRRHFAQMGYRRASRKSDAA
jgi:hypothetical protein